MKLYRLISAISLIAAVQQNYKNIT